MAYLRSEKEKLEINYPIEKVWTAIPEAAKALQWTIEEKNDATHHAKVKTKAGFMSYSSTIYVDVEASDEKTTHMTVTVETPVTTITSVADFGRTRDRLELLVEALAKEIEKKPSQPT